MLERSDETRKSKGYAIEYLIDWLKHSGEFERLDALVVIDADSTVGANLLEQFASGLERGSDWMQCYDCVGNADRSCAPGCWPMDSASSMESPLRAGKLWAFLRAFAATECAFPREASSAVPWHAHGLVEDLEYSWNVRISGGRIDFIKETTVFATMLSKGGRSLADQRRRWEFGRSTSRRDLLGPLLKSPHLGWLQKTADAIELASPPTSHIVLGYFILSGLAAFAIPRMMANEQFYALASICTLHFFATITLLIHGLSPFLTSLLPWRFALSLGYFPYYAIWKIFVMANGGPDRWIRTARECDEPAADERQASRLDCIDSNDLPRSNPARGEQHEIVTHLPAEAGPNRT